jgi:hypothetical protein
MVKCENCKEELSGEEIGYNWHFGKFWFCGNACATAWSVKQHLKKNITIIQVRSKRKDGRK